MSRFDPDDIGSPPAMDRLLTPQMVEDIVLTPAHTLREWVRSGAFPKPLPLPDGREMWRQSDIERWMNMLAAMPATPPSTPLPVGVPKVCHTLSEGVSKEVLDQISGYSQAILTTLHEIGNGKTGSEIAEASGGSIVHPCGAYDTAVRNLKELGLLENIPGRGYWLTEFGKQVCHTLESGVK